MSKEEKKSLVTIGIHDIKYISFDFTNKAKSLKKGFDKGKYEFNFHLNSVVLEKEKQLRVELTIDLNGIDKKDNNVEIAQLKTTFLYRVVNFEQVIKKINNSFSIPDHLFAITSSISVSTARGMFVMNLKDTLFSNAIIPIMDGKNFVPKK